MQITLFASMSKQLTLWDNLSPVSEWIKRRTKNKIYFG